MTRLAKEFRRIARKLGRVELMETSADVGVDDSRALVGTPEERRGPQRFLDFYGDEGLTLAFERYGLLTALRERGYRDFEFQMSIHDERHTLLIDASHDALQESTRLVEIVVRRDRLVPTLLPGLEEEFTLLTVDWLMMQDPLASFVPEKPRLPGQEAPGLGMAEEVLELLYRVVERLELDGLLTSGEHFHNAVMYRGELSYLDPVAGGICVALEDALLKREALPLSAASWAVEWGLVREVGSETPYQWTGEAQVRSVHPILTKFLRDPERRRRLLEESARRSYAVDRAALAVKLGDEGVMEL